jgi:hypothetical protein
MELTVFARFHAREGEAEALAALMHWSGRPRPRAQNVGDLGRFRALGRLRRGDAEPLERDHADCLVGKNSSSDWFDWHPRDAEPGDRRASLLGCLSRRQ